MATMACRSSTAGEKQIKARVQNNLKYIKYTQAILKKQHLLVSWYKSKKKKSLFHSSLPWINDALLYHRCFDKIRFYILRTVYVQSRFYGSVSLTHRERQ